MATIFKLRPTRSFFPAIFASAVLSFTAVGVDKAHAAPAHGVAMYGTPQYPADFTHYSYTNPDAPKGGALRLGTTGTFDSLNPFIVKGRPGQGMRGLVFESLMDRSQDEAFTLYGLLAQSIDMPEDRSRVTFSLNPTAKFSDGTPVTVDDVIFTWETLKEKGKPFHRSYYSKVVKIERPDAQSITFIFNDEGDREIPLIMGLMPILPKHIFKDGVFEKANLDAPIGSGPYRIKKAEAGLQIVYERRDDYWGKDLPVNVGRHNVDKLVYDYYLDSNAAFEAFKKGLYDMRGENDPTRWATGYDFPAVKEGRIRKQSFVKKVPSGMKAMVFNTRRTRFEDKRVREALSHLFDFEWVNKNLYYNAYKRTQSFYDGSVLGSHNKAASDYETALLAKFPGAVSAEIMAKGYQAPKTKGDGRNRTGRRIATKLLAQAGYEVIEGQMTHVATQTPLTFEILVVSTDEERLALNFKNALKKTGINVNIRNVDSSQYQQRRQTFDFDMVFNFWYASLSPGNEQLHRWGSAAADQEGSFNYAGTKDPAVDAMMHAMLGARTSEEFVHSVRALDRVLLSGAYVIPLYYQPDQWVALWDKVKTPAVTSVYGYKTDTWWIEE